jgi:hypothetical protein
MVYRDLRVCADHLRFPSRAVYLRKGEQVQSELLFTPKLTGERFETQTLPADVLSDIAAMLELLVSLAKAADVASNPKRIRARRNFDKEVQLHLGPRGEGSTTLPLMLVYGSSLLLAPYQSAFATAQTQFTEAIISANQGKQPSLNPKYLGYFDKIGRSLREGEGLQLAGQAETVLTPQTRHRLIEASRATEWTERETLRARVSGHTYEPDSFKLKLLDGTVLPGTIEPTFDAQLLEAHSAYKTGDKAAWLLVECVVRKERPDKLKSVDAIQSLTTLDPLDIPMRVAELSQLKEGWLDGGGLALHPDGLQWFADTFERSYDYELPLPHLYPTPEGGVQAEWMFGREDVSLNVDLERKAGIYNRLNLDTDDAEDAEIALADDTGWQTLNKLLTTLQQRQDAAA